MKLTDIVDRELKKMGTEDALETIPINHRASEADLVQLEREIFIKCVSNKRLENSNITYANRKCI